MSGVSMKNRLVYGTQADFAEQEELQELYEAMCSSSPADYHRLTEQKENGVFLFHLSPMRGQLVEWLDIKPGERILELGAQAGALTQVLLKKGAVTDAIEPSRILAEGNAARNGANEDFTLFNGYLSCAAREWSRLRAEAYDTILLAGSLASPEKLLGHSGSQEELLQLAGTYLRPEGRLILAIENRMGLKYWAGCREESTGEYFGGIEGRAGAGRGARTKEELQSLLESAGYGQQTFYYPYPDIVFPTMMYSDDYLPRTGELRINLRNYDTGRFAFFDERKAWDMVIKEGLYPWYANGFLVIAAKGRK